VNERYSERVLKGFFLMKEELLFQKECSRYREAEDAKARRLRVFGEKWYMCLGGSKKSQESLNTLASKLSMLGGWK
jgi:hypothetical protein